MLDGIKELARGAVHRVSGVPNILRRRAELGAENARLHAELEGLRAVKENQLSFSLWGEDRIIAWLFENARSSFRPSPCASSSPATSRLARAPISSTSTSRTWT